MDMERQKDVDARESDVFDGTSLGAEISNHPRGSADKYRFNTLAYQRRTKQKVVTDFSTVSKGASVGAKPRAALRQVLFSQSEKNPASEERAQLDLLKQDLGTYAVPVNLKWIWKEESQGTTLEKNWTEIVDSHLTMARVQRHQQEALWEFVHTELAYINKLIIIKDLVIAALVNLHRNGFLLEVTPELLFSNLLSILSAHQMFWQEVIYPMLQEARRTGMPFDPMRLEAGCLQFHQLFSSYKHYCWEEEHCLEFTRRQMENNPQFFTFVQWVETHPQSQRMRLGDMQAKPHQRITKYPLLLKAVLKSTQDPHVQHALRGMLSSVNSFLDSINSFLKLKDEELALSISAQRVDGYEVEGINEEIDKYVRDTCHFDLECPIRGVGPGVVRKLLLEENLKIRGRKDNKLEVVALLFSDVLLMTKVHKKGERLKVVRPPLALDRTHCVALKDGCSFVLIEVGELQTAMNVYIFAASTAESCSTWVSTIQQAKETLRSLREVENKRKMENWRAQQLQAKRLTEAQTDDMDTEEKPAMQSGAESFVDKLNEEFIVPQSVNGILETREAEEEHADDAATIVSFFHSQPNNSEDRLLHQSSAGWQTFRGLEWIEMGVRRQEIGIHREDADKMAQFAAAAERSVTAWNPSAQSASALRYFNHTLGADQLRPNTRGPHALFLGGYPDIDYPMNEESIPQPVYQPAVSSEFSELPGEGVMSARRNSDSQSLSQTAWMNSNHSQSSDTETSSEAWSFSKNLKSPGLRRRRPTYTHQGASAQPASLSNLESDYKLHRNSFSSQKSSDSHRVLTLASLKLNQEMTGDPHDQVPQESQILSEPEPPDLSYNDRWFSLKQQRSYSNPNIIIEEHLEPRMHSRSLYSLPSETQSLGPNGQPSRLEGLLNRAKVRLREKDGLRRDRTLRIANLRARYPSPSPSFSTTPSPPPSDGDRDPEWEEEVALMRHRALTVSKGWKEQLVDGDEDDKTDSVLFSDGVNVDWPGWCFDDDEVMDHLHPTEEGLLEGISRSLAFWDVHGVLEQEDGECSQV